MMTSFFRLIRRYRWRQYTAIITIACLITSSVQSSLSFANGTNQLYITPNSSQMNIGTTFSINVRSYTDSDQSVGNVNGTVTFPTNLLQVTAISTNSSGYGAPTITQGSGTIGFNGSRNPAPSGSAQIFAITFKALAAGSASVGFNGTSQVNNASTTYSSGVYTIINPNPPTTSPSATPRPPTTPKPSPVPVSTVPATPVETPSDDTEPQPTLDPSGVVDGVVVNPLYSSSTVTWKVNAVNPTSSLSYGTSSSQLDQHSTVTKTIDGSFTATITKLTPGLRYYFAIEGGGDNNQRGSYSGTIITRGFPVTMTFTENNIAAKNVQVKIGTRTYTTTSAGKLTIGLAAGNYSGTATTDTASLSINLTVLEKPVPGDGNAPETQTSSYNLTSSPLAQGPGSSFSILSFIGVLLGGTVVLGFGFIGFMAYRRRRFESGSVSQTASSTVVIEDGYSWHQDQSKPVTDAPANLPDPSLIAPHASTFHNNSVHISDEEPLDMFEQAKLTAAPTHESSSSDPNSPVIGQNPNPPHSTTP